MREWNLQRVAARLVTRLSHFISSLSTNDESAPRFMSDIRLHTLRNSRTRNGYSSPSSRQHQSAASASTSATSPANLTSSGSHSGAPMPRITLAAAASSSSSFSSARRAKGRRRNEYGDGEPEEEATLLGEGERDPGFLHDDEEEEEGRPTGVERVHDTASQVRVRVAIPLPFSYDLWDLWLQRSTLRRGSKDKSRTVPLRPPGA